MRNNGKSLNSKRYNFETMFDISSKTNSDCSIVPKESKYVSSRPLQKKLKILKFSNFKSF